MFLILSIIVATTLASPTTPKSEVETTTIYTYKPPKIGGCFPPPDPPHGRYKYLEPPFVEPGQEFDELVMEIVCDRGYGIVGNNRVSCGHSFWSTHWFPRNCERFCAIPQDEDVEYRCPVQVYPMVRGKCLKYMPGGLIHRVPCPIPEGADKGYRPCKEFEPNGTVVQPVCRGGGLVLPAMTCVGGEWDVVPGCQSGPVETTARSEFNVTDSDE